MDNIEQQINKQLKKAQEQQQINHIHWLLTKNSQKGFFHQKSNAEGICQWVSHRQENLEERKRSFFSQLNRKGKDKPQKKYSRYIDVFNETQTSSFYKYENLSSMPKKQESSIYFSSFGSPKKLNLKLSVPSFIQQYSSNSVQLEANKISLPLIKKFILPAKFLKNGQKRQTKGQEYNFLLSLIKGKGQIIEPRLNEQREKKNGKMMGSTKKSTNASHSLNCKSLRNSLQNNKLKECITFIKS